MALPNRLLAESVAHHRAGMFADAEAGYRKLLALDADHLDATQLLGALSLQQGKLADASDLIGKAIARAPEVAAYHSNLGTVLKQLGQYEEAGTAYRRALSIAPSDAEGLSNLGHLLRITGAPQLAMLACRRAVSMRPGFVQALINLGNACWALGDPAGALSQYEAALHRDPAHADALLNMGSALADLGKPEKAEDFYRRALCLLPANLDIWANLGSALNDLGQVGEGVRFLRRALLIRNDDAANRSNLLFALLHLDSLSAAECFTEHRYFSDRHEARLVSQWPNPENSRDPERRLRVGIVSADLRDHPVARLLLPIAESLMGSEGLDLIAYSNHPVEDGFTGRLRACMVEWTNVLGLTDDALAEKIAADRIDILIDLSGHTRGNRLLAFARKPAPLQASWLGYPATTGLHAMDYYIADSSLAPPGIERFFSEKIARLPVVCCFETSPASPSVNRLPALRNGYVTFGSLNRFSKMSEGALDLWAKVLQAVPESRLLIGNVSGEGQAQNVRNHFAGRDIAPDRLEFVGRVGLQDYLRLHHRIDLILDSFPYSGGTTSAHAVWMGVPVITLVGEQMPSRQSASLLYPLGLDSFVTHSEAAFVAAAVRWAGDLRGLDEFRQGVRDSISLLLATETASIASGFERALRQMWRRWCAGLAPQSFEITQ